MNLRKNTVTFVFLALCAWGWAPALVHAQSPPDSVSEQTDDADETSSIRARVIEKVRQARKDLLVEQLGLDDAAWTMLEPILERHDATRMMAQKRLRVARRTLHEAVRDQSASTEELRAILQELDDADEARFRAQRALFDDASAILTVWQLAELRVALPIFEEKVRKLVRNARQERRAGRRKGPFRAGKGQPAGSAIDGDGAPPPREDPPRRRRP